MTDDDGVSLVFARLAELAIESGAVPDDGSGLDGTLQTEFRDPDTGDVWYLAINGDIDESREVEFPDPHGEVSVPAGQAIAFYDEYLGPVALFGPNGGRVMVDGRDELDASEGTFPRSTEDQLGHALDVALDAERYDVDLAPWIVEAMPDALLDADSEKGLLLAYEERYLDVEFRDRECPECGETVEHRVGTDSYRDVVTAECSNCGAETGLDE